MSSANNTAKIISIGLIVGISLWLSYLGKKKETEDMREQIKTLELTNKEKTSRLDAEINELEKTIAAKDSEIETLKLEKISLDNDLSKYHSYVTSKTLYFEHDLNDMKDIFIDFCEETLQWLKPNEELITNREKAKIIREFKKSIVEKIKLERRKDHEQRRNL